MRRNGASRGLARRMAMLYLGLVLYGASGALQVRSGLGLDPWDVLHQGIAAHTGLAIGTVSIIVGAVVLLGWIPLRQWPGLGTVSNVVLVGSSMNGTLALLAWRIPEMLGGILLCGLASGMYIGARFGPGPRDGLMTGLARRTGRSLRLVRVCIELTVLAIGWLLGGTVGVGTVLFAVSIGPLVQFFLPLLDTAAPARAGRTAGDGAEDERRHGDEAVSSGQAPASAVTRNLDHQRSAGIFSLSRSERS